MPRTPCCGIGWRAARDRIRVGGLWLCDNTIWSGHLATATKRERQADVTAFIREHTRLVADDTRHVGSIMPIRDGVMTALRIE
jgi:caffeoyl-CoA O-methyltransferase